MNEIHNLLTQAAQLHNQKDYPKADALYRTILQKDPNNIQALHFHALILAENNQLDTSIELLERTLKSEPKRADFFHNTASIHARIGNLERAIELFSEAIFLKPDYAEAYFSLIEIRNNRNEFDLLNRIEEQLEDGNLSQQQKMNFHFAAARICDESEQFTQAFKHFQKANALRSAKYDINQFTTFVNDTINIFTPEFIRKHKEQGLYSHQPVFVLGMPRSGTTLIEQILSSHSMIFGAGELQDIPSIGAGMAQAIKPGTTYPSALTNTNADLINGFALSYLKRLQTMTQEDHARIINKHPFNFKHIGLILLMFPNAKIIHTTRNPLDTLLSCYFQNFTNGQEYSFNLDNLADYYTQYARLMRHWRKCYKGRFVEIKYEDVISQTERSSKLLMKYIGLPWEEACLDFTNNDRPISTASKLQARSPIYSSSVNRWKNYEKHIQPLIKRLKRNLEAIKNE